MNLKHTGDTFCCLCGNEETSIKSVIYLDVILLCMDEKWENVVRVYIIPSEYIETLELSIYLGTQRVSKWDEFRVDKKPYNDAYHNLKIENCTMLKNEKENK